MGEEKIDQWSGLQHTSVMSFKKDTLKTTGLFLTNSDSRDSNNNEIEQKMNDVKKQNVQKRIIIDFRLFIADIKNNKTFFTVIKSHVILGFYRQRWVLMCV